MFHAVLMVCSMLPNAEPPCMELHNNRGNYTTVRQCEERIEEMKTVIPQMFTPPYVVAYKCDQIGEPT